MQNLFEKYEKLIESKKYPQVAESEKTGLALVLENTSKHLQTLKESTTTSDIQPFEPLIAPVVRRVMPNLIANEIMGVQPIDRPNGYIFSIHFRYTGKGKNAADRYGNRINPIAGGQIVKVKDSSIFAVGDKVKVDTNEANVIYIERDLILIDAKIAYANATITDENNNSTTTVIATYSNELSFRKVLREYTGPLPTTKAELLGYDIAEIGFEVRRIPVNVQSRKLKAEYTVEMYQDLKALFGLNADQELINMMSLEVAQEINRELIEKVNDWCAVSTDFYVGGAKASGSQRYEMENIAHLGLKILNESREIARWTRKGAGNVMIVSPRVATMLQTLKGFVFIENDSDVDVQKVGTAVLGTFNGIKVVVDNFAENDYITILYKGADRRDAIGYFAPYVPVSFTRIVHPESGQPGIILNTRYGVIENPINQIDPIYGRTFNVVIDEGSVLA